MDHSIVSFIREDGKTETLELKGYGAETHADRIFEEYARDKRTLSVFHIQVHSGGTDIRRKYVKD